MREILFRGFCPNGRGKQIITLDGEDIRGDWKEGSLIQNKDASFIASQEKHSFVGYCYDCDRPFYDLHKVIPETVCQYTGLIDKEDRRVWEGDMVASYGKVFKTGVKWDETQAGYAPFCSERTSFFADECSITGDKFSTRSVE